MIPTFTQEALKAALFARRKQMGRAARMRAKKPTRWLYPWATERHYAAAIRAWLRPLKTYIQEYLKNHQEALLRGDSARQDSIPGGSYRRMVQALKGWFQTYIPELGSGDPPLVFMGLGKIAEGLNDFNEGQWQKAAKAELGIEFPVYEDWWLQAKEQWVRKNYELMRELGMDYINQVNGLTEQAITNGWSSLQLAKQLLKADHSLSVSRANFIARDQMGKLNGQATQARMESIGLTMYIWSTGLDERVRESHALMEGGLCRWDDSSVYSDNGGKTWKSRPAGAVQLHPGYDYCCRCTPLSYWDELVDEVDQKIAEIEGLEDMIR